MDKLLNKYKKMPTEARAAIWFTFCTMVQKGILFITSPIFTRIMSQEQYGQYCIYISWMNILSMVLTLNLQAGVFNNAMHKFKEDRDKYISCMHGLSLAVLFGFFTVFILFKEVLCENLFLISAHIIYIMFIYILLLPGFSFWTCRNRFEYKYVAMVLVTVLSSVFSLIAGVVGAIAVDEENKANAALFGYVLIYAVIGLVFTINNVYKGKKLYDKTYWKYAAFFNIPLLPHYLSMVVLGQADRIMIGRYCGNADAGMYGFVYNIATALNVLTTSINQAIVPWQYKKMDTHNFKSIADIWNMVLIFLGVGMLVIIGIAPEVIGILGTKDYLRAVWVVPPVVLGIYFTALYSMYSVCEFYFEANKFIMAASVIGAVLNVVLNAVFIPKFGYIAAAYTTLVCYIIYATAHIIFSSILTKRNFGVWSVYDIKKTVLISGIVSALSFLMMFTYFNNIVRYTIVLLIGIASVKVGMTVIKKITVVRNSE